MLCAGCGLHARERESGRRRNMRATTSGDDEGPERPSPPPLPCLTQTSERAKLSSLTSPTVLGTPCLPHSPLCSRQKKASFPPQTSGERHVSTRWNRARDLPILPQLNAVPQIDGNLWVANLHQPRDQLLCFDLFFCIAVAAAGSLCAQQPSSFIPRRERRQSHLFLPAEDDTFRPESRFSHPKKSLL